MLTKRSLISLSQYLALQQRDWIDTLFEKHDLNRPHDMHFGDGRYSIGVLQTVLTNSPTARIESLLSEIGRTQGSFRNRVSPRYEYDQRWRDLTLCLELDGYVVESGELRRTEPNVDGTIALEDDLTRELNRSGLMEAEDIITRLNNSAEDFRRAAPDLNGALTNARVALQTLATAISRANAISRPGGFDESKWGQVAAHLRTSGLITQGEEIGLAGVFTFVSPGAHTPVGLSETEMVRLGRSLVVGMCYFLIKRFNG